MVNAYFIEFSPLYIVDITENMGGLENRLVMVALTIFKSIKIINPLGLSPDMINTFLTLCYWPIYIWEREGEEEVGSGDPNSLPWPIWKLSCDWYVDTKQTWQTQWGEKGNPWLIVCVTSRIPPARLMETRRRDNQPWIPSATEYINTCHRIYKHMPQNI